jgi:hypothetical protein
LRTTARQDLFTSRWRLVGSFVATSRLERAAVLGAGVILVVVGYAVWGTVARPALPPLTEFYMLGPQGLAQDYPRATTFGAPVGVLLGVHNVEGRPMEYRVVARDAGTDLAAVAPFQVATDDTWTGQLSIPLAAYGFGQEVDILLFRTDDDSAPYRQLTLIVDVAQPGVPTPVVVIATPARTAVRPEPTRVQNPEVPTPAPPVRIIRTPGPQG